MKVMERLRPHLTKWRGVDIFVAAYLLTLIVLAWFAPVSLQAKVIITAVNLAAILVLDLTRRRLAHSRRRLWQFVAAGFPLLLIFIAYRETGVLMHVFYSGWFDQIIIDAEYQVFKVHPALWLESYISPALTEFMMAAYVSYIPLLPVVCALLYFTVRPETFNRFMFSLTLAYALCFLITQLVPVEGPRHSFASMYTLNLDGWLFRGMTRLVERFGQLHGGAFPSPHCAAGTVMVYYCARYHRRASYFVIPVVISFMAGAVYGRYHYLTDVIAGIAVAVLAMWVAPALDRLWISVSRTAPNKLE